MTPPGQGAAAKQLSDALPEAAFERWYHTHHRRLRAWCVSLVGEDAVAEDIAQEALARAWASRERLGKRDEVGPWLWRVARNLCVDHLRSRRRLVPVQSLPERPDGLDPADPIEAEEERRAVRRALASLNPRHRELLYLHHVRGLGYDELATRTGLTNQGARSVLFRARQGLRDRLRGIGEGTSALLGWAWVRSREGVRRAADKIQLAEAVTASALQTTLALAMAGGLALAGAAAGAGASAELPFAPAAAVSLAAVSLAAVPGAEAAALDAPDAGATAGPDGGSGSGPSVNGRIDPDGEIEAGAKVDNPATNGEEYVWVKVWIEEDGRDNAAVDAARTAARGGCDATEGACATNDEGIGIREREVDTT